MLIHSLRLNGFAIIIRLSFGLSVFAAWGSAICFAQESAARSYTSEELRAASISWLHENPFQGDSIHIYRLTCPTCIDELSAGMKNPGELPHHLFLNTLRDEDRSLAIPLVACVFAQNSEERRIEIFKELLGIYVSARDYYWQHVSEWQDLVFSLWGTDASDISDPEPWADAINLLDRQNRLVSLLDKNNLPDKIELDASVLVPDVKQRSPRDQRLIFNLAIPFLHNNDEKSETGIFGEAKRRFRFTRVELDYEYLLFQWRDYADNAANGTFWQWNTLSEKMYDPAFIEWNAALLDLPSDAERRKAFSRYISKVADLSKVSPVSLLEAIKTLPVLSIPEERKEKRVLEAKRLIDDIMLYFRLRR